MTDYQDVIAGFVDNEPVEAARARLTRSRDQKVASI